MGSQRYCDVWMVCGWINILTAISLFYFNPLGSLFAFQISLKIPLALSGVNKGLPAADKKVQDPFYL